MASYFQSYFLTSNVSKRLIHYALAKLEILDTDALDLENLDIAWGNRSTFEFRDVGLRLKKLDALLQLPPSLEFVKAKVLLLRLTIPVDIFSSPIQVEIDGVESHLRVNSKIDKFTTNTTSRTDHDRIRRQASARPSGSGGSTGPYTKPRRYDVDHRDDAIIPSAEDLAQSFLQMEPEEERAELEAAILSETQDFGSSSVSSEDGEIPTGTGANLTLPDFMTRFLKGIYERLQVRIHGITVNLDIDLPTEFPKLQSATDPVTVQLRIEDIDIEGLTQESPKESTPLDAGVEQFSSAGRKLVTLSKIRGCLISDANFFSSLAHSSALSSPSTNHTESFERKASSKPASSVRGSILNDFDGGSSPESESLAASGQFSPTTSLRNPTLSHLLEKSIVASDSGRFEDAPEDDNASNMSSSGQLSDGDSVLHNSAFLDQVTQSQYLDDDDDDEISEQGSSIHGSSREFPAMLHGTSALSTPRASIHVPVRENEGEVESTTAIHERSVHPTIHSTMLPNRRLPRFSDGRVSRSQPTLPGDLIPIIQGSSVANADNSEPSRALTRNIPVSDNEEYEESDDDSTTPLGEDLTESQLFSHEDAESMYMSAISHKSSHSSVSGSFVAANELQNAEALSSRIIDEQPLDNLAHARNTSPENTPRGQISLKSSITSIPEVPSSTSSSASISINQDSNMKPLPRSSSGISDQSAASSDDYSRLSKRFFDLDSVKVYLPASDTQSSQQEVESTLNTSAYGYGFDGQPDSSQQATNMPGAFSTHLPVYKPLRIPVAPVRPKIKESPILPSSELEILVGHITAQFDVSIARLILKLVDQLNVLFQQNTPPASKDPDRSNTGGEGKLRLSVKDISIKFLERLEGTLGSGSRDAYEDLPAASPISDVLLQTSLRGLQIESTTSAVRSVTTSMTVKKFSFGYAKENIVFFDSGLQMGASVRDLRADAGIDISVKILQEAEATRYEIVTLPMHVTIDLQRLDETFSWFGGLSGVLNLGSSIASNATVTVGPPSKPKPRGVTFDAPIRPNDKSVVSQNKADVRIGGFMLDFVGTDCYVSIRTSAVKLVSRDEGIGVTIQKIKLTGPHLLRLDEDPAISIDVTGTRMEFHPSPKHGDLELLLSLITPSKSKYDQDDDLILDTLLRQRKQGSVLRLTIDDLQVNVSMLHRLTYLPELGEEVARLATVAKYLPDDERPGLLSLILVNKFRANIDVDKSIGTLQLISTEINVAQITLPALVALSIGTLSARRNVSEELVGFATDPDLRDDRAPCIMARMIGDEMEPVVKIKLWNVKVEYRVPTLIALLGLAQNATSQDMTASLTASVATLTDAARSKIPQHAPSSGSPAKPLAIDIVLKDCVIGLNPSSLPSKMLVVVTEAHSTIVLPKDGNSKASLDLSKASLLVIDNVAYLTTAKSSSRSRRESSGGYQVTDLCAMGFVSVSYISSARVLVDVTKNEDGETSIDVELRDDMFILESCADSTQTIISIFGALSPPTPPSVEIKYRTNVIPVHDLLASLSGDAFGTAEGNYNIDDDFELAESVDEDGSDEIDLQYGDGYGDYDAAMLEDIGQSIASLRLTSRDTKDGVLLASFIEPPASAESTEEPIELDFKEDHFGTGSILEGTAHQWNSQKNTYDTSNVQKLRKSPLKVCIRDVHFIWKLFDGYDWQDTRDTITKAIHEVESKAIERRARNDRRPVFEQEIEDDDTVIGDFLFNSIYIGIPSHREPGDLSAAINLEINDDMTETESIAYTNVSATTSRQGNARRPKAKKLRLNRSRHHKISFELTGVSVDFVLFPPDSGETQSSIDVRIRDLEVYDNVPTSTWRKFATCMQDVRERETGTSMAHIEILNVRPVKDLPATEIVLKLTVLPLRLHVDQDALDFITRFFEFKDDSAPAQPSTGEQPFLQRVEVNAIEVKLDFKPKRVDYAGIRSGHTTEFMNFLILDEADMVLRHTIIYGISGFEKLGKCLNDIWMPDIKRNQLPGILAGIAPVRSVVNVGSGLKDLVFVPIREYKKDGRIVRSISKGAAAFAKTTGTELVKLGAKVAIGVQTVLQGAEDFLGPVGEHSDLGNEDDDGIESKQISHYANQPIGVLQGLRGGYTGLQRDLLIARDAIIAVPGEVMDGGNAAGVLRAVRKHAPTVILRPAIGVAKAGGQILMGATNSLDPKNLQKAEDKYKRH